MRNRYLGAMLGLACGDAVGTTVEFCPRGSFNPVTDMVGGGPFGLRPGQWTDDTSMALCLAESLLTKGGFDPVDQMVRYLNWWKWGYLSSTGSCFDIGMTVRSALAKFEVSRDPYSGAVDPHSAGNGSLMRLAPVILHAHGDMPMLLGLAADSSRTTHGAAEAVECCQLFGEILSRALSGMPKEALLDNMHFVPAEPNVRQLMSGEFLRKDEDRIRGSGYCMESLEAALWCFYHTDSLEEAVLRAVNLGDDADTTGAIVGQIAGAYYGVEAIPSRWLSTLAMRDDIELMADSLYERFASKAKS
ncbi:ADP-ribosylglycohydrolase family protein [Paucimonas lemoignei]|nr:ADP-ribosylglycohydrolase family protein [Paucimonas lemoignei]